MPRGKKKATGFLTCITLLVGVIVIVQMFSTKRPNQQQQPIVPAPAVQPPHPAVANVPHTAPPAGLAPLSEEKLAKQAGANPDAKKPSTPRSRVLFTCGRNLDKADKKEGAIYFYRELVKECRGTP